MRGRRVWSSFGLLLAWGCAEPAQSLGVVDASGAGLVDAAARDGGRTVDAASPDSGPPEVAVSCDAVCDVLAELAVEANVDRFEADPRIADARCAVGDALLADCEGTCASWFVAEMRSISEPCLDCVRSTRRIDFLLPVAPECREACESAQWLLPSLLQPLIEGPFCHGVAEGSAPESAPSCEGPALEGARFWLAEPQADLERDGAVSVRAIEPDLELEFDDGVRVRVVLEGERPPVVVGQRLRAAVTQSCPLYCFASALALHDDTGLLWAAWTGDLYGDQRTLGPLTARYSPSACGLLGPQPGDLGCTAWLPLDMIVTSEGETVTVPFGRRASVGPWDVLHASGLQGPATCLHQGGAWSTGWVTRR